MYDVQYTLNVCTRNTSSYYCRISRAYRLNTVQQRPWCCDRPDDSTFQLETRLLFHLDRDFSDLRSRSDGTPNPEGATNHQERGHWSPKEGATVSMMQERPLRRLGTVLRKAQSSRWSRSELFESGRRDRMYNRGRTFCARSRHIRKVRLRYSV